MRFAWLFVVGGCSALVPSDSWHPKAGASCPSLGYPVADVAVGVPAFSLGAISFVSWMTTSEHTSNASAAKATWVTLSAIGLLIGSIWSGSAIYGFSKEASCHDELRTADR